MQITVNHFIFFYVSHAQANQCLSSNIVHTQTIQGKDQYIYNIQLNKLFLLKTFVIMKIYTGSII